MSWLGIAQLGLGLLGLKGARDDARAQAEAVEKSGKLKLGVLRRQSIRHGFNPLTVLNATGGAGFTSQHAAMPSFLTHASQFGTSVVNDIYETRRQQRNDELAGALMSAQTANLQMQTELMPRQYQPITMAGPDENPALTTVPTYDSHGWTPVYGINGQPMEINSNLAERLGLKAGDVLMAEDHEALSGDFGSIFQQAGDSVVQLINRAVDDRGGQANPYIRPRVATGGDVVQAPVVQQLPPAPLTVESPLVAMPDAPVTDGRPWW